MTVTLKRYQAFYNPYGVEVNDRILELNRISIYDVESAEMIASTSGGWFEPIGRHPSQRLKEVELEAEKVYMRRTLKLDGNVFVNKDNDYWDSDRNPRYILYIPNTVAGFKHVNRFLSFHFVLCDVYESEKLGAKIECYRPEYGLNKKIEDIKRKALDLIADYEFSVDSSSVFEKIKEFEQLAHAYQHEAERLKALDLMAFGKEKLI